MKAYAVTAIIAVATIALVFRVQALRNAVAGV